MLKPLFCICTLFMILSCGSKTEFEGTYIRTVTDEYSRVEDSLIVKKIEGSPNMYSVHKNTGFYNEKDDKGNVLPPRMKQRELTAFFDKEKNALSINETGDVYQKLSDTLTNGKVKFSKIK